MSDTIQEEKSPPSPQHQQPPTMAETQPSPPQDLTTKLDKMSISLSIWPPTQRTRDAVISSLIKTLSTQSILSKRYGTLSPEEADSVARTIEDEAFSTASSTTTLDTNTNTENDDGIEILQIYSKEISKRMLETVKSKAAAASGGAAGADSGNVTESADQSVASEETTSVEPESG